MLVWITYQFDTEEEKPVNESEEPPMLRKILESKLGPMTNSKFAEVMDLTTVDIRINNIGFGRRTSMAGLLQVAEISFRVLSR